MAGIGILGDIHGNLPALEAVLEHAGECDEWWCVGDIVGYGPFPNECVERVRSIGGKCVTGNHDLGSTGDLDLESFNIFARIACEWTGSVLEPAVRGFLSALRTMETPRESVMIVHGSVRDPVWEYVTVARVAEVNFAVYEETLCFNGHTHVPVVFASRDGAMYMTEVFDGLELPLQDGTRYMANAGSVGQPRDLDPRACYCVFHPQKMVIEYHRVEYPVERVQARMAEEGLPEPLIARLVHGR